MSRIDTETLLQGKDLKTIITNDLGEGRGGHWKCPLHRESNGYSLSVKDQRWTCFGAKCAKHGDAIGWVMEYRRLSFVAACEFLAGGTVPTAVGAPSQRQPAIRMPAQPPSAAWQQRAVEMVYTAMDNLWAPGGERAMTYLRGRGLECETIKNAMLGYLPGSYTGWNTYTNWMTDDGQPVSVPFGITIPHMADGNLWGVRVRRSAGTIKYQGFKGGKRVVYNIDSVTPGVDVLMTEGEFDALIAMQVARHYNTPITPVALVGASNTDFDPRWQFRLVDAPRIFARMDNDEGGRKALARLKESIARVTGVQVPCGKDVNEFYLEKGRVAVNVWLGEMVWQE